MLGRLAAVLTVLSTPLASVLTTEVGRDEARRAAQRELSKAIYHRDDPSLVNRLLDRGLSWMRDLLDHATAVTPGGWPGLLAIAVLLLLIAVAIRLRIGPVGRSHERGEALFSDRPLTVEEHRAAAERYATEGSWAEAVRERLRAIARALTDRAILDPRPGRTADELATEAGAALPTYAEELYAAVRLFDDVWYGGRQATPEAYRRLCDLDGRLDAARPAKVVS